MPLTVCDPSEHRHSLKGLSPVFSLETVASGLWTAGLSDQVHGFPLLFTCSNNLLKVKRCCRGRNESKLEEPPSSRLWEVCQTLLHWANTPAMCYVCHPVWLSLAVVCLHLQWAPDLWGCGLLQSLMSQRVLAGSPLQPSTPKSASRPLTPFFVHSMGCSFLSAIPHIVPLEASHASFSHS